jgi:hypothetical protein
MAAPTKQGISWANREFESVDQGIAAVQESRERETGKGSFE